MDTTLIAHQLAHCFTQCIPRLRENNVITEAQANHLLSEPETPTPLSGTIQTQEHSWLELPHEFHSIMFYVVLNQCIPEVKKLRVPPQEVIQKLLPRIFPDNEEISPFPKKPYVKVSIESWLLTHNLEISNLLVQWGTTGDVPIRWNKLYGLEEV